MRQFARFTQALAWLSSAAATMVGCGDSGSDVQRNQFQSQLVHALCDGVQGCCAAAERGFDPVHCRQTVIQQFVIPLSDLTLHYDADTGGRCVQAVNQAAQACKSVDITTCYGAFTGNVPAGGACRSSFECMPGPDNFALCGTDGLCWQPPRGAQGQPCSFTCVENGGTPRCHSVFYGAAAGHASVCHSADALVCVADQNGAASCQPVSADCKENPERSCEAGETCNLMTGACYKPVALGGNCAMGGLCGTDGYCASGICYPVKANAATCAQDVECASGKCDTGFCVVFSKAAADWCGASTRNQ